MHTLRAVVVREMLIKFTDVVCFSWSGLSCDYKLDLCAKRSAHKSGLYPVSGSFQSLLQVPGVHNIPAEHFPGALD